MPSRASSTSADRLAGSGALAFLVLVAFQNVLRGATAPANDATAAQLTRFLHDKGWTIHVLVVTYLLGLPALFLFASGLARRIDERRPDAAIWSGLGKSAVTVVAVLFGLLNALQVTMLAARDTLAGSPATLTTLWTLHNAVFGVNLIALAAALLGFGRASALAGLLPRRFEPAVYAGAALLAVAAAPAVAEVHGSKLLALGLVGFVLWLVFLSVVGIRLLRGPGADRAANTGSARLDATPAVSS